MSLRGPYFHRLSVLAESIWQTAGSFIGKHGSLLLTPEIMPDANVEPDNLPSTVSGVSEWLQEQHPEVGWGGLRDRTAEEIERAKALRQEIRLFIGWHNEHRPRTCGGRNQGDSLCLQLSQQSGPQVDRVVPSCSRPRIVYPFTQ